VLLTVRAAEGAPWARWARCLPAPGAPGPLRSRSHPARRWACARTRRVPWVRWFRSSSPWSRWKLHVALTGAVPRRRSPCSRNPAQGLRGRRPEGSRLLVGRVVQAAATAGVQHHRPPRLKPMA